MKKLLLTGLLLLVTGSAFAFGSDATTINGPTPGDLSMVFLGQIFGTVGNIVHGSASNLLGHLFYQFNKGVFVVAGLWLGYTTATMVVRSATEGSFMSSQPGAKNFFTMIRIPIGLALLIPVPSTGYESYQSIVMEVVKQGVGLADTTWDYALQYLHSGGQVYMTPSATQKAASTVLINNAYTAVNQVMSNQTCVALSNYYLHSEQQSPKINTAGVYQYGNPANSFLYTFPGIGQQTDQIYSQSQGPACGWISWDIDGFCSNGGNAGSDGAMACSMAKAAVAQIVNDVQGAAKAYACHLVGNPPNSTYCAGQPTDFTDTVTAAMSNAIIDYQNLVMPIEHILNGAASTSKTNFIKQAEKDGWVMAGRYYWDIIQLNDEMNNTGGNNLKPLQPQGAGPTTTHGAIATAINTFKNHTFQAATMNKIMQYYNAQNTDPNAQGGDVNTHVNKFGDSIKDYGPHIGKFHPLGQILYNVVNPLIGVLNYFSKAFGTLLSAYNHALPSPIVFLHTIGMALFGVVGSIWVGGAIAAASMYVVGFICSGQQPVGQALAGAIDWIRPLIMVIVSMLMGAGVILAFYAPLYPYLLFTFATVGWLITVIEAMVAAPLVCLGLTQPEGHDFLGRAEQALMLLLSVFVRPVLLIIGLLAAMVLSYVGLLILNTGFASVIDSLFNSGVTPSNAGIISSVMAISSNSMNTQSSFAGKAIVFIVAAPTLLMIYSLLVFMVIQQCFSLIHVLPENIMIWIGGPKQDLQVGQMAKQMESPTRAMGSQTTQGLSPGMGAGSSLKAGDDRRRSLGGKKGDKPKDK